MNRIARSVLVALSAWSAVAAPTVLFDFERGMPAGTEIVSGAETAPMKTPQGTALRVKGASSRKWPGMTFHPPGKHWNFSQARRLAMDVRNVGSAPVRIGLRFDAPGEEGSQQFRFTYADIPPAASRTLWVAIRPVPPLDVDGTPIELPGMWAGPWGNLPWRGNQPVTVDPSRVSRIMVYAGRPEAPFAFEVDNLRLLTASAWNPPDGAPFFPFVDEFGQYIHETWPGKTHAGAELASSLERELVDLTQHPRPDSLDRYGGWQDGPTLAATGCFRSAKHAGKWWLVDPEGKLFFSWGITSVRLDAKKTPVTDRARWFRWLPAQDDPRFGAFLGKAFAWSGAYKHKQMTGFSFGQANMRRRYGDDWPEQARTMAHTRLHSWGMNTIGNWSDIPMCRMQRTPYTVALSIPVTDYLGDAKTHNQRFPDVFHPTWEAALRRAFPRRLGETVGDPWCIGYFVDNELEFDADTIPRGALSASKAQPAKQVFKDLLRRKYGTIAKLNASWGTEHASWDTLLACREAPDKTRAQADYDAFLGLVSEKYFSTIRAVIREMAPGRLYLGSRFNTHNRIPAAVAAKYCDVVSYNLYRYPDEVAGFAFPGEADVPLLIGEWHFGARDRGVFFQGIRKAANQTERARLLKAYMRGVLAHPQFVGAHWFRYRSEPCSGRDLDGENGQLGFVDICDSPYAETIAASREVGRNIYPFRSGSEWKR